MNGNVFFLLLSLMNKQALSIFFVSYLIYKNMQHKLLLMFQSHLTEVRLKFPNISLTVYHLNFSWGTKHGWLTYAAVDVSMRGIIRDSISAASQSGEEFSCKKSTEARWKILGWDFTNWLPTVPSQTNPTHKSHFYTGYWYQHDPKLTADSI